MDQPPTTPRHPSMMIDQPPAGYTAETIREPGAIKTFGVLHLVIACFGMLYALYGVVMQLIGTKVFAGLPGAEAGGEFNRLMEMTKKMQAVTYFQSGASLLLGVMLIIAGLNLLKAREKGRTFSIKYAITSIVHKLIYLLVTIFYVMPITKEYTESIYREIPGGDTIGIVTQIATLLGIVVTFTYPVLVFFMMRSNTVTQYLKGRE